MKKCVGVGLVIIAWVAILTGTAWSVEQEFNAEWRTRSYINYNWDGDDNLSDDGWGDYRAVDTRVRLFYKAGITEGLRFNLSLEIGDMVWGEHFDTSTGGYWDWANVGTDDLSVEVKHMFADFDWGRTNWKVGAQELVIARGFIVFDDFYAANVTWNSDQFSTNFIYAKLREGMAGNYSKYDNMDDGDLEFFGVYPKFTLNSTTVVPGLTWVHSGDIDQTTAVEDDHDSFYLSVDIDHTFDDESSIWFTGIYKGGSETMTGVDTDFSAWLVALGGTTKVKGYEVHGQAFYATGDDDATDDEDNAFSVVNGDGYAGQSYYWAEILGYGWFDYNYAPTGSPADQIGNIWAVNLGETISFTDRTSLTLDLWKAELVEENAYGETDLGVEIDARLSTQIIPDYLYVDVIAAYLFAGDAVSADGKNDENPVEAGVYLAIYF